MKITAQQIIDAAHKKGFKIINEDWRDYRKGEECRCPLNCIAGTEGEWFENTEDIAEALNTSYDWVNGFLHAIDGGYQDSFDNNESKAGYLNGLEVYRDLVDKGHLT